MSTIKAIKSIELREDNIDEVLQFTGDWGKIDPADGKFKLKDYGGATVVVNIGDHIGLLDPDGSQVGYMVLGFSPDTTPDLIHDSQSWVNTLIDNKDYYRKAINDLTSLCAGLAKEAGWDKNPREVGTELMLIVSEVSEAMEGDRKNLMDDHLPHRRMFDVELGDAQIRIFHLAGRKQVDLGSAIVEKLIYNTTREDHKPENREAENGKKY